ncbi:hypothetical protein PRBRB14_19160 [Hallella multisaccharivorax DSM 17128]|nr:hypothetical protein PRBRB14_19160 [Hallella multisaccharivorax DSM 17128]
MLSGCAVQIDAGGFDALMPHQIGQQRYVVELLQKVLGIDSGAGTNEDRRPWCSGHISLCPLLHHIIPGEDFVFGVLVKKIEGRPGELKNLCAWFRQFLNDRLAQFCLNSLMRFVNNQKIP